MMRSILGTMALLLAQALFAASAQAATMTFDSVNVDPAARSYAENGILATGNGTLGMYSAWALHFDDGGTSAPSLVTFTMGSAFDAIGFDIAPIAFDLHICDASRVCISPTYPNVSVQGFRGSELVSSLVFDMGSASDPYRILLGAPFRDLTALTVSVLSSPVPLFRELPDGTNASCGIPCSHFKIDNVELAPVPVPAGMPLAATGLAVLWGLGRWRRRQT